MIESSQLSVKMPVFRPNIFKRIIMVFTVEMVDEINLLTQFNLKNEQDGIKVHHEAAAELIAAAKRLHDKGIISQHDGGYLTDLGRKAAEHAQDLLIILK